MFKMKCLFAMGNVIKNCNYYKFYKCIYAYLSYIHMKIQLIKNKANALIV